MYIYMYLYPRAPVLGRRSNGIIVSTMSQMQNTSGTASPKKEKKKIVIAPIQDKRSRQGTFLKRKNGLLKKAYELGVLCECEVAVIIFNCANGKLFEYSSTEMQGILHRYATYSGPVEKRKTETFFDIEKAKGTCNIASNGELCTTALQASTVAGHRPRPVYKFDGINETQALENGQKLSHGECPPGAYNVGISKLGKRKAACYADQIENTSAITPTSTAPYAHMRNIRPRLTSTRTAEDWAARSNGLGTGMKSLVMPKREAKSEPMATLLLPASSNEEGVLDACTDTRAQPSDETARMCIANTNMRQDALPPPQPPPPPSTWSQSQAGGGESQQCSTPDIARTGDETEVGVSLELGGMETLEGENSTPRTTRATTNTANASTIGRRRARVCGSPTLAYAAGAGGAGLLAQSSGDRCGDSSGGLLYLPRCGSGGVLEGGGWSPPWNEVGGDREGGFSTPLTPLFCGEAMGSGGVAFAALRSAGAAAGLPLTPRAFGLEFLRGVGRGVGTGAGAGAEEEGAGGDVGRDGSVEEGGGAAEGRSLA